MRHPRYHTGVRESQIRLCSVLHMKEEFFGLFGPLQNRSGEISQVAVIKDSWEDCWGNELDMPKLHVCQYNDLYGWDKDPYKENIYDSVEIRVRLARYLRVEIVQILENLDHPDDQDLPLEGKWFEDAELPLHLVDGIPESCFPSERRGRINVNRTYH